MVNTYLKMLLSATAFATFIVTVFDLFVCVPDRAVLANNVCLVQKQTKLAVPIDAQQSRVSKLLRISITTHIVQRALCLTNNISIHFISLLFFLFVCIFMDACFFLHLILYELINNNSNTYIFHNIFSCELIVYIKYIHIVFNAHKAWSFTRSIVRERQREKESHKMDAFLYV